ncbi:MAG: hypothetical protein QXQ57_00500 [Sulfolobales archaeon]
MIQELYKEDAEEADNLHPTLIPISRVLSELRLRICIIGAKSVMIYRADLGRESSGLHHDY